MEQMQEHTLLANAGHFLIILAFVAALAAGIGYVLSYRRHQAHPDLHWQRFGRLFFSLHSLAALAAIGLLFYSIASHYFEFHYVWKHSNRAMEAKYIFSCFWSGQEGSLLLWSFWIIILAWIAFWKSPAWETAIMPFLMGSQVFIFSMLLGVYLGDVRIGSSPFILIRQLPENAAMPWAQLPDYLSRITAFQDGVGLNPLLQNYWMTIHPPLLFLGFASTLLPFAFAMGGLWQKRGRAWVKPALAWAVFSAGALGTGILLGGAWAYESLSFGGFWAWDPVENASLVPWLLLVGGVHSLLISEKRKKGYFMALLLTLAPFLLVLYSSFLTRSGILGESSVHSFTENGLFWHLLIFLGLALWGSVHLLLQNRRLQLAMGLASAVLLAVYLLMDLPSVALPAWLGLIVLLLFISYEKEYAASGEESALSSREFWMFMGGLVLVVSAIQITLATSIPVINRLFGTALDAFTDLGKRNTYYASWQVPMAIVLTFMMGAAQYLRYRKTGLKPFLGQLLLALFISGCLLLFLVLAFRYSLAEEWLYVLLLFACVFAMVTNADYAIRLLKGRLDKAASAVAHAGFALLLLGAMVSASKRVEISRNQTLFDLQELNEQFRNNENILLRQGDTLLMDQYFVTYQGKKKRGPNLYFQIGYFQPVWDAQTSQLRPGDSLFSLQPVVQLNEQFGNVAEPDTRHFLTHDVFTHIKWADMQVDPWQQDGPMGDGFMNETRFKLRLGKAYTLENYQIFFQNIFLLNDAGEKEALGYRADDLVVKAELQITDIAAGNRDTVQVAPLFVVRDSTHVLPHDTYSASLDTRFRIAELSAEPNTLVLGLRQREYVVMQALVFPGMNLLWTGCLLMVLGCFMAVRQRFRQRSINRPVQVPVQEPGPIHAQKETALAAAKPLDGTATTL